MDIINGSNSPSKEQDIYMKQMQLQRNIEQKLRESEDIIKCDNCNSDTFEIVHQFKKISALVSEIGKEIKAPVQVFRCTECKVFFDDKKLL